MIHFHSTTKDSGLSRSRYRNISKTYRVHSGVITVETILQK